MAVEPLVKAAIAWLATRALGLGLIAVSLAALIASPAAARSVTDSAGRTAVLPAEISRVFASGPPASVLLYALAPEMLVGWSRALSERQRRFIAPAYRDLPEVGRLTGRGDTANLEAVLAAGPDLIVDYGSIRDTFISLADRTQAQINVPYLLIDGRFEALPESLRLLGDILGKPERADALAAYAEATFAEVDAAVAKAAPAPDTRVPTYLARGADGLETAVRRSLNAEILERAGARNVAAAPGQKGVARISPEQLLAWQPALIVTWDENFYRAVFDDPVWQSVPAVATGRVYLTPLAPFGWIDRPPSLNRLIGLRWLVRLLYPEAFEDDLETVVQDFYTLFYQRPLSDPEITALLAEARPKPVPAR